MADVRGVAALSLAGAVPAALGGVVFSAAHRRTAMAVAIAYGFWFAAALMLVLMVVAARKWLWRRTSLPVPEGWEFVTSAIVLTAIGAAIDAVG
jgi:dolichyl-phosphate-mannose--protein O-mannosyl transferase